MDNSVKWLFLSNVVATAEFHSVNSIKHEHPRIVCHAFHIHIHIQQVQKYFDNTCKLHDNIITGKWAKCATNRSKFNTKQNNIRHQTTHYRCHQISNLLKKSIYFLCRNDWKIKFRWAIDSSLSLAFIGLYTTSRGFIIQQRIINFHLLRRCC